jgi:hypothetical protein
MMEYQDLRGLAAKHYAEIQDKTQTIAELREELASEISLKEE